MSDSSGELSSTEKIIEEEEKAWLPMYYNACRTLFNGSHLPSHDHSHHLRVWMIARSLLEVLSINNYTLTPLDVRKNMASVFFHDTGMVKTLNKSHGKESALFCLQFFEDNNTGLNESDKEEIISAIIRHDDKEYHNSLSLKNMKPSSPLKVLPVCDDLDAYGYIGIFRYTEIYLLRKIPLPTLATQILPNLNSRYQNFLDQYSDLPQFIRTHKNRFSIIRNFFSSLDKTEPDNSEKSNNHEILRFLEAEIKQRKSPFQQLVSNGLSHPSQAIKLFFRSLNNELNQFNHPWLTD